MKFHCCDRHRRNAVNAHPTLNGLDYLEVLDRDLPEAHPYRQRTLFLHFLKPVAGLDRGNLRLEGGERVRGIAVDWASSTPAAPAFTPEEAALLAAAPDPARVLVVRTRARGDRSTYRLRLVRSPGDDHAPPGYDPALAEIDFSFKVECESGFDCRPVHQCDPEPTPPPEINYLAKDYGSFRRLLLDRMAQLLPGYRDPNPADLGAVLTELLAYAGDHLSYRQDAAATEAYLGTARSRVSLRRHALMVDYPMHDGCNARTWLQLDADADALLPAAGTQFLTHCPDLPVRFAPGSAEAAEAMQRQPEVFEPMHALALRAAHNLLPFHTWGDERCCLARGSTRATLRGHFPDLAAGDFLLLEEVLGPASGKAGDADPGHRHVVRLVSAEASALGNPLTDPLSGEQITEIAWAEADALPFALCVSAVTDEEHGGVYLDQVSLARGNVLLADHGRRVAEPLPEVRLPRLLVAAAGTGGRCDAEPGVPVPARFRPRLSSWPLTQAVAPSLATDVPASLLLRQSPGEAQPQVSLTDPAQPGQLWQARRSLLASHGDTTEFVVEIENDGIPQLRFGDDRRGRRPAPGSQLLASYRIGNGSAGNVGAGSIHHALSPVAAITGVRNPLPAVGGVDPESSESVRRRAPEAFRRQERAVTTDDYAAMTQRHEDVANAAATLRWTGSWHTVFVTPDRTGGETLTESFAQSLQRHLDRYRMAGHDLDFREPLHVPLELALHVCVKPGHFRSDVRRAIEELFSNRVLRDGRRGLFHPDHFSFGQTVYLSRIYAAAHAVPGVLSAQVTTFRRQGGTDSLALADGRITLGALEIARLDNDPNHPERGVLDLELHGGK
ncbi:putative baseplate assembly protein [Arenimonas terrae]|uniref:Putative baseplate assembly protein n=1 Tax=Arenimonas terrae TaxID=2546226 RepID=A0A5C4RW94_9GAMM|nr:putative baseplate assembly protein [Arenimonas terrae]TNJ35440.1 putative baseplate assembly protein [Arenimonas terrae]